ncbi:Erg28-like protein [Laetiporus sulphureus 93-53]|uniref:Erg28-like protein n=1 Tax=Laetiporus sulphureus 93-53 TaxID=1314785 RepID=A0A165ERT9_9APHY|nr:Erg28-like protein [Laetiporus sulphureus 93-53]KZT07634.1 Erg28-like protein [Laetiporus sulphureus 93-53]
MALLPQTDGWLPKWQLFVAAMAVFNSVQNYATLRLTRQLYSSGSHNVTALQARTFAIWTLTSAAIRFYAAYYISDKRVYDLAMFSYLFAFAHFASEILIFRSAKINSPVLSPVLVSTISLVWMFSQYDYYVKY